MLLRWKGDFEFQRVVSPRRVTAVHAPQIQQRSQNPLSPHQTRNMEGVSKLLREPPPIVYQCRRTETNTLDSVSCRNPAQVCRSRVPIMNASCVGRHLSGCTDALPHAI